MRFEHTEHDGRPHLRLIADDGALAEVSLHGGHVTSWQPTPGRQRLYLSPTVSRAAGTAIRGGIPVVFPQFAGRGPLVKHGFARLLDWRFTGIESGPDDEPTAVFELRDGPGTHAYWPRRFLARLHVALTPSSLEVGLEIRNDDVEPWAFTAALHTYLRVEDLAGASLHGLEAAPFLDSTRGGALAPASGDALRFACETDRIYPGAKNPMVLSDGADSVEVTADGFRDTVVWNPGAELAASIADLGAGEHRHFVCVESATVIEPVALAPHETWRGIQRLRGLSRRG